MLEQGDVIDGRFEVENLLGEGGLAAVYRVRHVALGSVHALKLLSWRKKSLDERLILEGRIQAQLNHPNIVAVTDLVRHEGQLGLLMEYVDNESLEEYLGAHGGMGLERGLEMFAPILSAVSAAHALGVTHRDLKPANILLANTPKGLVPKVTDFGIAKVVAELAGSSTAVGSTMGTPGYLAPEQVEDSSTIDARADVFALGAIAWELVTGHRAFADENGECTVLSTTRRELPPLDRYVGDVPASVQQALDRAVAKDPAERFPDCGSFAEALFAERPDLLVEVLGNRSTTSSLSLSGIRQTLESSLDTGPTTSPETMALPEEEAPPEGMPFLLKAMAVLLLVGGAMTAVGIGSALTATVDPMGLDTVPPVEAPFPAPVAPPLPSPPPGPAPPDPATALQLPANATPAPPDSLVAPAPRPPPAPEPFVDPAEPVAVPVAPNDPAPPPPVPALEVPAPAPEPAVVEAPAPEPAVVEAPTPEPAVVEAPAPEPAVIEAPEPAVVEAPASTFPEVAGTWKGKASRLPLELRLVQGPDGGLSGNAVFAVPPRPRDEALRGTLSTGGAVRFRAADLVFTGQISGRTMSGTYEKDGSGKALSWSVSR